MTAHMLLLGLSVGLLLIAGVLEFPWDTTYPKASVAHTLGWFGAAAGFASMWL